MNNDEKIAWRDAFMKKAGRNASVLKGLFEALPNVMFHIVDKDERMVAMNPPCLANINVTDELEIVGESIRDFFPQVLAEVFIARDREVLESGEPIVNRIYPYRSDRALALRSMNVWPLTDARGRIIGTAAAYVNVASDDSLPEWYGRVKSVVAYIDAHYAEDIPLEKLAQISNVSKARFCEIFKSVMDISPGRYITTIRLNAARNLLTTTDMLITEIATATGFWDQSHFVKTFKRERGETPSQYRKRMKVQYTPISEPGD